jgi:hypothetical protein|tara:strand:- start:55 stop:468 length:414 start_codon:yes stop_codon:yes gene_type:complete
MKQVHTVAPDKVNEVWGEVKPLLNAAFLNHDDVDYGIEYLKEELVGGKQHLFLVVESAKIIGAYTVELVDYTNHRIALTTCIGGKGMFNKNTVQQWEDWARSQGVTKIRAYAKEAQARLFKLKMGLQPVMRVLEKRL